MAKFRSRIHGPRRRQAQFSDNARARRRRGRGPVRRPGDRRARRARAQPEERRSGHPARQAGRVHRPLRLGQVVARLRHDLRRRPAALCRVALGLRPPVPRDDAEAGRRPDRRPVARHRHRAEDDLEEPALDRRHRDRDPRLHAPALGARRHPLFAGDRPADREPDGEPDGRPRARPAGAHAALSAGPGRARPQGRIPQGDRRVDEARLPAPQDRRPVLRDRRRAGARQEAQARRRSRGRPHCRAPRHGGAARREFRDGAGVGGRTGGDRIRRQGRRRERAEAHPLLLEVRLSGLRLHHRRDRAADCSPSTTRTAPARSAAGSARSCASIRRWSSRTRS